MGCEICGQKMANCDCTPAERELFGELESLTDRFISLVEDYKRLRIDSDRIAAEIQDCKQRLASLESRNRERPA